MKRITVAVSLAMLMATTAMANGLIGSGTAVPMIGSGAATSSSGGQIIGSGGVTAPEDDGGLVGSGGGVASSGGGTIGSGTLVDLGDGTTLLVLFDENGEVLLIEVQ